MDISLTFYNLGTMKVRHKICYIKERSQGYFAYVSDRAVPYNGSGHRAQGTELGAQGTEQRAQGAGHRANGAGRRAQSSLLC